MYEAPELAAVSKREPAFTTTPTVAIGEESDWLTTLSPLGKVVIFACAVGTRLVLGAAAGGSSKSGTLSGTPGTCANSGAPHAHRRRAGPVTARNLCVRAIDAAFFGRTLNEPSDKKAAMAHSGMADE